MSEAQHREDCPNTWTFISFAETRFSDSDSENFRSVVLPFFFYVF